jgi:two-component system chemotaxis response regulator CheB
MPHRDIVVIGASAGGIEPISAILGALPKDLAAAVFIVVHISPQSVGYLPTMFTNAGGLPAKNAEHGEAFTNGQAYVAPPDHHLLLNASGHLETIRGPRENRVRPAVDPLFRSAALSYGSRVIGIVLSGGLDDGTSGLRAVKMCGGVTIVQDPADAVVRSMPASALRHVRVDYREPADRLGALIVKLVETSSQPSELQVQMTKNEIEFEVRASKSLAAAEEILQFGEPTVFTCPECHGALLSIRGERPPRFRCHTGHAFTMDTLLAELSEATEQSIWNTIRSMQEGAILLTHLAGHWREQDPGMSQEFERQATAAHKRAELVRGAAGQHPQLSEDKVAGLLHDDLVK